MAHIMCGTLCCIILFNITCAVIYFLTIHLYGQCEQMQIGQEYHGVGGISKQCLERGHGKK